MQSPISSLEKHFASLFQQWLQTKNGADTTDTLIHFLRKLALTVFAEAYGRPFHYPPYSIVIL